MVKTFFKYLLEIWSGILLLIGLIVSVIMAVWFSFGTFVSLLMWNEWSYSPWYQIVASLVFWTIGYSVINTIEERQERKGR